MITGKIHPGRPIKYSHKEKLAILNALELYVESEEYPSMPDFAVKQKLNKRRLYEWARDERENADTREKCPLGELFKELIERANNKQEQFIEKNALLGRISPAFASLKLRQPNIGWSDNKSVDANITGSITDPDAIMKKLEGAFLNEHGTA